MSAIVNLRYLCKLLLRNTLYQVSFDHDFLEMCWLIESKVASIIAPHQTKKYFFSEGKKPNVSEVSTTVVFLHNSTVPLTKVKNICKTHKCQIWKLREKFQENIGGCIVFDFTNKNIPLRMLFCNFLKYFGTHQDVCFWNYPGK